MLKLAVIITFVSKYFVVPFPTMTSINFLPLEIPTTAIWQVKKEIV
jgi:hypothetical protein